VPGRSSATLDSSSNAVPTAPRIKRVLIAAVTAAVICGIGVLTFLANIHGGSAFSRGLLAVAFPTLSLGAKFNLLGSPFLRWVALVSAFLLWAAITYLVLYLVRDDYEHL
jgi:hypothetical protein